jgi:1,4-alpha-glucan branching enzyme
MSDRILAASEHALRQFLRHQKPDPVRHRVHYCTIDLEQYWSLKPDPTALRAELAVAPNAKLLLFVGSMIDLKNPLFLIEMLPYMLNVDPHVVAVFAGAGPDQMRVAKRAQELGIADRVRVLGWCDDVRRLMLASDLFVNPRREHPTEAFGLVNLEAQAVGLRTTISDGISSEPPLAGAFRHPSKALSLGS